MAVDFERLAAELLARAEELVPAWLPEGKREGHEWAVGNLAGDAGDSLKVNLHSGKWADFAAGSKGGDLTSLYAAIHNLSQLEAAKRLGSGDVDHAPRASPAGRAPEEAPAEGDTLERPPPSQSFNGIHGRYGAPSAIYPYRDREGILYYVCRYEPRAQEGEEAKKQIVPWRWVNHEWRAKHAPRPRPLYQLDELEQRPLAPVLIVEGEKCVDAAAALFKKTVVTTWSGGTAHAKYADWRVLAGRTVTIWPDADVVGQEAGLAICGILFGLGATVKLLEVSGQPDGWDIADAIAQGWTLKQIIDWGSEHSVEIKAAPGKAGKVPAATEGPAAKVAAKAPPPEKTDSELAVDERPMAPAEDPNINYLELWRRYDLSFSNGGLPHCNLDNVVKVLSGHPAGWSSVWYDEFRQEVLHRDKNGAAVQWGDVEDSRLALWFQRAMGMAAIKTGTVSEGTNIYAHSRKRNEAREWLSALDWDGTDRLEDLCPQGFGTETDEYHRAVGRCFIMGIAARILRPGCKLDNMPVFEGRQGTFKGSALEILGGPYYAATHVRIGEKDFYLVMRGKMLIEISELAGINKMEIETVKGIISTATDTYRAPYERRASDHPRMSAFAGTTNADEWNVDDEARRFWPVKCGFINLEWLKEHRSQLFAEARARVDRGEMWWDVPAEAAAEEQAARQQSDALDDALGDYLAMATETTVPQCLMALGIVDRARWDRALQNRVIGVLKRAGFSRALVRKGDRVVRLWRLRRDLARLRPDRPESSPIQDF